MQVKYQWAAFRADIYNQNIFNKLARNSPARRSPDLRLAVARFNHCGGFQPGAELTSVARCYGKAPRSIASGTIRFTRPLERARVPLEPPGCWQSARALAPEVAGV